ncbi:MAG: hypothetical protein GIX00_07140 [Candidatus Eremiobacteraeota bacterium]|nr:hypothetical protein [Candidatus Eremiobacteraeota bacterium]MBC5808359.1 hypothetical protein [Candidatus Eremiobacteraeota bacterium]
MPALSVGDRVLVPLRGVLERLGATVSYDAGAQIASAVLDGTTVKVSLRSPEAWVNGEHRRLDGGAREIAGRTMIPLRFVAETLGVSVAFDGASNTVLIVSGRKAGNFAASALSDTAFALTGSGGPKIGPSVEDERPSSGELIGSQYPQIYARFAGGSSPVNPATVRISVDGVDVTGASAVSSAYVSYTPEDALQTGSHSVSVEGASDDGTRFADTWRFRVDAGSSSLYMPSGFAGAGAGNQFFNGGTFNGGPFNGNLWNGAFNPLFPQFGFFPPGFSVFTPGPLFFVSGNLIEVVLVTRFFPFGQAFFTISGFPGSFPLSPWPGNPGFFWGTTTVPFGASSRHAVIAANFTTPSGRRIVVHSTAPLTIDGTRKSLPRDLRYAVLPKLLTQPTSPHRLVVFQRVGAPAFVDRAAPVRAVRPAAVSGARTNSIILRTAPSLQRRPDAPRIVAPALPAVSAPAIRSVAPAISRHAVPAAIAPAAHPAARSAPVMRFAIPSVAPRRPGPVLIPPAGRPQPPSAPFVIPQSRGPSWWIAQPASAPSATHLKAMPPPKPAPAAQPRTK